MDRARYKLPEWLLPRVGERYAVERAQSWVHGVVHHFRSFPSPWGGFTTPITPWLPGYKVLNLDGLVVTPAMAVEGLQQFILEFEELDGAAAVDVDEALVHMVLALPQEAQARQADCNNLHRNQGFYL